MALNSKNNAATAAGSFVVDEEAAGQKAAAPGGGGGGGGGTVQARRKGLGIRAWLVVLESGQTRVEEVGKHSIMRRTGLPARDLRALDPALSYPSSILGRERAIVVNLEHIKAIITAKEVLMLNPTNPLVVEFVRDLQHRIDNDFHHNNNNNTTTTTVPPSPPPHPQEGREQYNDKMEIVENATELASWGGGGKPPVEMGGVGCAETRNDESLNEEEAAAPGAMDVVTTGRKVPPFEFRALEACLESACRCLESETQTLEKEAYPALDELTSQVSTLNLERVRQIKSRLVAISGRVQKVRDELEHLLDDDNDMAEMYLTEKLAARLADHTSSKEQAYQANLESDDERDYDCKSEENSETYTTFKPDIEELEMLLEAYFAQIDGILQKLYHMREYVDDTEDFINIMLDDKQNQLLEMGVMLSTANMIINAGIVVVGLFGMNISIALFDGKPIYFWSTVMGTCGGCVALYVVALAWAKKKKLLAL